ncbi:MAG: extracellular solute-binding protein [Actinomycetaceae bacterium]|nr:extracellular solute-binding protein [Actinomycetaceae bacterium]
MNRRGFVALATISAISLGLSACAVGGSSSSSSGGDNTIRVVFWDSGSSSAKANQQIIENAKASFEQENADFNVEIVPVKAGEGDYATKLALQYRSESTAPDVIYEDTYRLGSDAAAGYLAPIDEYLADWDEWKQYPEAVHQGATGMDGKLYGIPVDTDTRGIWYNKEVLEAAGVDVPWQPQTWDEVLDVARKIKSSQPDVLPMNIYAGKVLAEASSMQGFEMLLYGTDDPLYNLDTNKWVVGSDGFKASLAFLDTVMKEKLGPTPQNLGDTAWSQTIYTSYMPDNKIGFSIDGSWVPGNWVEGAEAEWPEWVDRVGWAAMPTQKGQQPGQTSMSGGWVYSMGANAKNKDKVFEFMTHLMNYENSLYYSVQNQSVAVRDDVAAAPEFAESNPAIPFFAELTKVTHFRPSSEDYESISNEIQMATEKIINGQGTPEEVAAAFDEAVKSLVGEDEVEER